MHPPLPGLEAAWGFTSELFELLFQRRNFSQGPPMILVHVLIMVNSFLELRFQFSSDRP
jgi:hypothetical protein